MILFGTLSVALSVGAWFLFRDSINLVQSVGPLYWITRDFAPKGTRLVSSGFMRELGAPWRVGKGIQLRISKNRTFQIGICAKTLPKDEDSGILNAVGGRIMEVTPEEIGDW
jgi:hypothetical protein